ncbi:hypothetical protein N7499_012219, partial [Penicillium canescens]
MGEKSGPGSRKHHAAVEYGKWHSLREASFPALPIASLSGINAISAQNRQQITFPAITETVLADAIRRAPPNKAAGADGIPNK